MIARRLASGLMRLGRRVTGVEPATAPKGAARYQEFAIGILTGSSALHFDHSGPATNPVLTHRHVSDARASLVADPFMLEVQGTWYMFFEIMNDETRKGEIALATSGDGIAWSYRNVVLAEPFHLSYPYVFEWQGDYWMIPESHKAGEIRLYRANEFPQGWTFVSTLVRGPRFSDSSLVRHDEKWWLFTETDTTMRFATERLYFADHLAGPWVEHPRSPIVEDDARSARAGGRMLRTDGKIIRYVQDCYPDYGTQVNAVEITELTPTTYRDRPAGDGPVLTKSGTGWNRDGMHHIDPHRLGDGRWMACVDGWKWVSPEASSAPR